MIMTHCFFVFFISYIYTLSINFKYAFGCAEVGVVCVYSGLAVGVVLRLKLWAGKQADAG